jgi:opacity protein-like surface antigen
MKKITAILLLLFMPVGAFAAEPEKKGRDLYVGVYILNPYVWIGARGLPESELYATGFGAGLSFGQILDNGASLGLDFGNLMVDIETEGQGNTMRNSYLMLIGGWGRVFWDRVRFSVGAGIGPSLWINDVEYTIVDRFSGVSETFSEKTSRVSLTYQVNGGAALILSESFDLDFKVKLQNLGQVANRGPVFSVVGDITQIELRLGLAYKFGLW